MAGELIHFLFIFIQICSNKINIKYKAASNLRNQTIDVKSNWRRSSEIPEFPIIIT